MQAIKNGRVYDTVTAMPITSIQTIEGTGPKKHYHAETFYQQGDMDWFLVIVDHVLFREDPVVSIHPMTTYEAECWGQMNMDLDQYLAVFDPI